ncbi:MAG: type Z 30S ribosomal protein S14 [Elusimicrobia bacterium]|jgi:small subunit ribosomal protein S14|nr:type Z 30S ribosomal protein S14 [Elusimicrobiota bacterium]
MVRKALKVKQERVSKYKVRNYNRCNICGRPRGYMRDFGLCRICFRNLSSVGKIPGVVKSSW